MNSKDERPNHFENSVSAKDKIIVLEEERITKSEGEISSENRDIATNKILLVELMHQNSIPKDKAETGKKRIIIELEHEIVSRNHDVALKEKTIAELRILLSNNLLKITFAEKNLAL